MYDKDTVSAMFTIVCNACFEENILQKPNPPKLSKPNWTNALIPQFKVRNAQLLSSDDYCCSTCQQFSTDISIPLQWLESEFNLHGKYGIKSYKPVMQVFITLNIYFFWSQPIC